MSHRDMHCRSGSFTSAQEIQGVFQGLLGQSAPDVRFRDDCQWSRRGLVVVAVLWAWSARCGSAERLEQGLETARGLGRKAVPRSTSYQAFLKLLVRWTQPLGNWLRDRFQDCMRRDAQRYRHGKFVVMAADGSKLQLARTQSNEACYAPRKSRRRKQRTTKKSTQRRAASAQRRARQARNKKADSPQMSLTMLFHAGWRLPWDWRLGPSDQSERAQLREMIPHLPADALLAADCGFVGYEFWADLLAAGRNFVIRVGGNVKLLKKLGLARERAGTVYLWPDKAAKRNQPPLVLRLVEVHDGRQSWFLVTSVLDARDLTDRDMAQIYRARWRIEVFFRHFKQTYGRSKLRSHKAEHARCEAEWSLWGLWAMMLHTQLQLDDPDGLSVVKMLRAFRQSLDEHRCRTLPGDALTDRLRRAVRDGYARRDKRSRCHPRKKYEPETKAPRIVTAANCQRKQAQQVTSATASKGLTA